MIIPAAVTVGFSHHRHRFGGNGRHSVIYRRSVKRQANRLVRQALKKAMKNDDEVIDFPDRERD